MDDILPKLLAFPQHPPPPKPLSDQQYDEGIRAQIWVVKNLSNAKLLNQTSGGESALEILNPSVNTVPFTFILLAHIETAHRKDKNTDVEKLWNSITTYLSHFDPRQMRYMAHELASIIEVFATLAGRYNQIPSALPHIRDALLRFDPTGAVLTSKHLLLVKMAIEARSYLEVVPVLDKTILYIPGASDQPKPKFLCDMTLSPAAYITPQNGLALKNVKVVDILEYFLLSGMVYIGLHNWTRAKECLEVAVTYPAKDNTCSRIMAEAYKKWILVKLLLDGKVHTLPKITSPGPSKLYHTLAKPYEVVAQIFENGTAARLKSEVEAGHAVWVIDWNIGLLQCVLNYHQQFQIRNLANTHSKLTIAEIHNLTQSAETGSKLPNTQAVETLVQSMIANGTLHATLTHPLHQSPILTFLQNGPVLSEKQTDTALTNALTRIKALHKEIKTTDRQMTYEKEYIKHAQKLKKNYNSVDQGFVGNETDWPGMEEEDLMGVIY